MKLLLLEVSSEGKEDSASLGKPTISPSLDKSESTENLIFGSWGLNVENKSPKLSKDFLPSLSRINIPNPPPLIHIPRVEEGSIEGTSIIKPSTTIGIDSKVMEGSGSWWHSQEKGGLIKSQHSHFREVLVGNVVTTGHHARTMSPSYSLEKKKQ
jgi:hypothetical protein